MLDTLRMNPQIRYCTTTDGVRIAYWAMGSGPPLLHSPPMPFSDIAAEMDLDDARSWYERMAQTHTLIRYDPRASGSSERDVQDVSIEGFVLDIAAVATALPFESYALVASGMWVVPAITFAARFPTRVSHLILWNGRARPSDVQPSGRIVATRSLIEKDWAGYTDAWAQSTFGWSKATQARAWSRVYRESTNAEGTLRRMAALHNGDASELLPDIDAPVLVVDHRKRLNVPQNAAQYLAANLRNARLVVLDGVQSVPAVQTERVVENARLIDEFTGVTLPDQRALGAESSSATPRAPAGSAIVLFTDIAESTALTERMGDAAFRDASRLLDHELRAAMRDNGGTPVDGKLLGDGVMGTFASAREAIAAAVRCSQVSAASELGLHIGLHAGDVIREDNNVYGGAVNIAARICALSAPGEILVSDVVRGMARTSAGVEFEDRGEQEMKGVGDSVRVYEVRSRE